MYGIFHLLTLVSVSCASVVFDSGRLVGSSFGNPGINATYDYVVVGGGTAGLTLATRLAQNGSFSVAVIEAGSFYELDNGNFSQIPYYIFDSADISSDLSTVNGLIDWRYLTTPQRGYANRTLHYTRGKCLGGSSARNYMAFQRPTVDTFDLWAKEVGDASYTWDNLLPFYKRSTHYTLPNSTLRAANSSLGTANESASFSSPGGPLQVSLPNFASPWSSYFPSAFENIGIPFQAKGTNAGILSGYSYQTLSEDPVHETRSSSESSFLKLALESTPIIIYTHAQAKRILFDGNKTAQGVLVDTAGMKFTLTARKEVILSAGAFGSPQLLMVSGIGPSAILSQHNIPVLVDRAGVGQNMWDNPMITLDYTVNVETATTLTNQPGRLIQETAKYIHNQTGMLTSQGADMIAFLRLTDETVASSANVSLHPDTRTSLLESFPVDWPDIELIPLSTGPAHLAHDTAGIGIGLLSTFSRGNVSISSSDTADAPIINPAWLNDPRDQDLAIAAFRYARHLASTPSVQSVVFEEVAPGPSVQTDEQILAWIQQTTGTFFHASVTCKMGQANDSMAVVDPDGKVYGVQGLRVVDISAFPLLPPGQPQGTVYMLAEKIAQRVLDEAWSSAAGANRSQRRVANGRL